MPDHRPAPLHAAAEEPPQRSRGSAPGSVAGSLARASALGLPARVGEPARRGLGGEPQEDPAPLARGGPARTGEAAQAATPRQLDNSGRAAAGRASRSGVGARLPVRHDQRRPHPQAPARRLRAHPRGARGRGRPPYRLRPHRQRARADRPRPRTPTRARAHGQRARADRERPARLVPLRRHRHLVHRARLPLGEPVRGILRRQGPRRGARRGSLRLAARGEDRDRRLEKWAIRIAPLCE